MSCFAIEYQVSKLHTHAWQAGMWCQAQQCACLFVSLSTAVLCVECFESLVHVSICHSCLGWIPVKAVACAANTHLQSDLCIMWSVKLYELNSANRIRNKRVCRWPGEVAVVGIVQETRWSTDDLLWAWVTWQPCGRTGIPQVLLWHRSV